MSHEPGIRSDESEDNAPPLPSGPFDLKQMVQAFEADLTTRLYAESRHNQKEAAERAGLTYDQFRHLLKKHALL